MQRIIPWVCAAVVGALYLYLGAFKFLGDPLTLWIFAKSGAFLGMSFMEPAGRLLTGALELIAAILVLILPIILTLTGKGALARKSQGFGAILAFGIVTGAIFLHLVALGIVTPAAAVLGDSLADGGAALPGGGFANPDPQAGEAPALFIMAVVSWLASGALFLTRRGEVMNGR